MTVTLAPETAAKLKTEAAREGRDTDSVANELLSTALDWAALPEEDEVRAIAEGLQACREGRVRPFEECVAEHRTKYPAESK